MVSESPSNTQTQPLKFFHVIYTPVAAAGSQFASISWRESGADLFFMIKEQPPN